uniref:Kringle domain-containing protein n=1 Tax=Anas platyrhynchos TaxID=8839 RepID=A0A8B9QVT9_ANAPL
SPCKTRLFGIVAHAFLMFPTSLESQAGYCGNHFQPQNLPRFFSHQDFLCRAFAYDRVTKRCHWLSFNSLTNDYVRNCIIGKGADYKGTISVTKSGIQCQAWNSMIPHEHRSARKITAETPEGKREGHGVFTTSPETRHEVCDIPLCSGR